MIHPILLCSLKHLKMFEIYFRKTHIDVMDFGLDLVISLGQGWLRAILHLKGKTNLKKGFVHPINNILRKNSK
jgi:hypothetical protein